ncbi:sigma-54 dependent transcriptional regulator [Geobacter sp.]|uniref:sigma-54-dependent transcriptional regulator n=1 Tax=Geobacter sp. TaxID=46610 RepID=UPI002623BDA9|nr:sigma-54 dependent transcriptional regulator [Geobacter sp.]
MDQKNHASSAIVLVDDEPEILFSSAAILRRAGLDNLHTLEDSRKLLPLLAEQEVAVIVLDLWMPHVSGQELLEEVVSNYPQVPVIVMTAASEIETAVACMKAGAFDYLVKPVEMSRFISCIRRALEMSSLRRENSSLRESLLTGRLKCEDAFSDLITQDSRMKAIFGYLDAVAETGQPVLIAGETGVGKERLVRALHRLSGRKGDLVAVNVAGLDDIMFSDTLFGHKKGAYTGAEQAREGMIAKAAGGTLFLDEIGDLNLASQVKLLRLLQEGEYYPLGSDVIRRSDARIVVATNQNLRQFMAEGKFRKDLYFRLSAHQVDVPPLRERKKDIPLLLDHFLAEAAATFNKKKPAVPPELVSYLSVYHFPGNIRELRAMAYDAMARHERGVLSMSVFRNQIGHQAHFEESSPATPEFNWPKGPSGRFPTLKEAENYLIEEALARAKGNQGAAASFLGISRQALNQRLARMHADKSGT